MNRLTPKDIPMPLADLIKENAEKYMEKNGIDLEVQSYVYFNDAQTPEDTAAIQFNLVIDPSDTKPNKYVLMQNFQNYGELSNINIFKLPGGNHRNVILDGYNLFLSPDQEIKPVKTTDHLPYLLAGGYFDPEKKRPIFSGSSEDYGDRIGIHNVNDIANWAYCTAGLEEKEERLDVKQGLEYVTSTLDMMTQNKGEHFYSQLIEEYMLKDIRAEQRTHPHVASALTQMKINDRVANENIDYVQATVDELQGIQREMMLRSVAERMKQ